MVIETLEKAFQPCLEECTLSWSNGDKNYKYGNVYRNEAIYSFDLMTKEEFDNLKVSFSARKF